MRKYWLGKSFIKGMLWLLNGDNLSFETIPNDRSHPDFKRLEGRIKSALLKPYREEKIRVQRQISELREREEQLGEDLGKKRIIELEWLRAVKSIDDSIANLRGGLEILKEEAKSRAEMELSLDLQLRLNNGGMDHRDRYVIYNWRYRNRAWDEARAPLFVHFGDELFFLKTRYIALTVSRREVS